MEKFIIIKYIIEFLLFFLLAYLFACIGNIWIKTLYTDNKKLLSFAGKSLYSKKRIYFITLMMSIIFVRVAFQEDIWLGLLKIFLGYVLILIIYTDFEQQVIFDKMIAAVILGSFFDFLYQPPVLMDRFMAAIAGGGLFLLLAVLLRGAIGGGDIKLIFALGLLLGTERLILVIVIGILLGAIAALVLLASKQKKRSDYFAYGPYFALPALIFYIVL